MAIVVESTANNTNTSSGVTITKPTGLEVGDLMVAVISTAATGGNDPITVKSGWTNINSAAQDSTDADLAIRAQYKVADSGDVAASNFAFTTTFSTAIFTAGTIMRLTNFRAAGFIGATDSDTYNSTATSTVSFTSAATPGGEEALVIIGLTVGTAGASTQATFNAYNLTPSLTFTEVLDSGINQANIDPSIGVAYASQVTDTEITAYGAALSNTKATHAGILVTILPTFDQTGTNALLEVSPTTFTQSGSADTFGSSALHEVSPTMFNQAGRATAPTQWSGEAKPSTSWTKET